MMEILLMNNTSEPISNINILGKIPIRENLESLENVSLVSNINPDLENKTDFKIYYSKNR